MSTTPKVLAFAGSLRAGSYNKKLVQIAAEGAREAGAEVTYLDLRDFPLPIFDEDLEAAEGHPENVLKLKEIFLAHQGLLIAAPEYNSSITAVLKNTIDWVSRPRPGTPYLGEFAGKVAGIMSASPSGFGGLRGLVTVRSILGNIGVLVLPGQTSVSVAHQAFDEAGNLMDEAKAAEAKLIGATVASTAAKLAG